VKPEVQDVRRSLVSIKTNQR